LPDAIDQALVKVSMSVTTSISSGRSPSASATIWAATVAWPCPFGVLHRRKVTWPLGSTEITALAIAPDLRSVRLRSCAVWAREM
jgi:hypothetical protein